MFVAAVALGTLPLLSPLDAVGDDYLLSAHMLQHVLIGDAARRSRCVALRGPLVLFFLPLVRARPARASTPVRRDVRLPDPAAGSLALWASRSGLAHPAAYDYMLDDQNDAQPEHLSFLVVGRWSASSSTRPAAARLTPRSGSATPAAVRVGTIPSRTS